MVDRPVIAVDSHPEFLEAIQSMHRSHRFAVAKILILNLPQVNAQFGIDVGNQVIAHIERPLRDLGELLVFGRISPSLFGLAVATPGGAAELVERVRMILQRVNSLNDFPFLVALGVGVADVEPSDETPASDWVRRANLALAESTQLGHGVVYSPQSEATSVVSSIFGRLTEASPPPDGMTWVFQPIVELGSGAVFGYEALCRWTIPGHGAVSPAMFVPLAQRTGVGNLLDRWTLAFVDHNRARVLERGGRALSINVDPITLLDDETFRAAATASLERQNDSNGSLIFELTEASVGRYATRLESEVRNLHQIGAEFAIDDFGTGETNLVAMGAVKGDYLKLDQSLVHQSDEALSDGLMSISMRLALLLDARVIAEGVETAEDLVRVQLAGAHFGQGWHLGMPFALEPEPLLVH